MKALEFLKKKGLEVRCSEDNLILRPVKLITEDVKAYVKKHKQEILNELRQVEENTLWSNPHEQGTPEARRETLTQCIDATWGEAFAEVRKALEKAQRQYRGGPEMVELEKRKEDL